MTIRVAAIEVSHWQALYAAACFHLIRMPDIQLVGVQDPDLALAEQRAEALGPPLLLLIMPRCWKKYVLTLYWPSDDTAR